ncbi:hypothetical protein [Methylobacterium sp. E-046]|uniref:hypothetical protein n=1 Tax=Methylobacterium sp. E-046 TaxID=2836576 RepID=UPI001FB8C803|nr:hypothetical protein [Methylobacterium sp. E-046]MCJ2098964.1 hypothetical protein [Methylobacterium sp. E-046]
MRKSRPGLGAEEELYANADKALRTLREDLLRKAQASNDYEMVVEFGEMLCRYGSSSIAKAEAAKPRPVELYRLYPHQVPDYPNSNSWVDVLTWSVAVMGTDDDDFKFTASLLSHAAGRNGLTEKQIKFAKRVVDRVMALWMAGTLECQQQRASAPLEANQLHSMEMEGHA